MAVKKMFDTAGLKVAGTPEQFELYSTDSHEFDYIKNSLEKIRTSVANAAKLKGETDYVRFIRVKSSTYLVAASLNGQSNILAYDAKEKKCLTELKVDDLENLRDDNLVEYMIDSLSNYQHNMVSEEQMKNIKKICGETIKSKKEPNGTISLTSGKGFYIGDPSVVLKTETISGIQNSDGKIEPGIYETYEGRKMMIVNASNGTHAGHDIYSGNIGIVPIELLDVNKVMAVGSENLDIRLGTSIKAINKDTKLYVAQSDIQEINTVEADGIQAASSDVSYSM